MNTDPVYAAVRDRLAAEGLAVAEGTLADGRYVDLRRSGDTVLRVIAYDAREGCYVNVAQAGELGRGGDPGDVEGYVFVVRDGQPADMRAMLARLDASVGKALGRPAKPGASADVVARLEAELRATGVSVRRWDADGVATLALRRVGAGRLDVVARPDQGGYLLAVVPFGGTPPSWEEPAHGWRLVGRPDDHAFRAVVDEVGERFAEASRAAVAAVADAEADRAVAALVAGPDGVDALVRAIVASGHAEAVLEGVREALERPAPGP